MENVYITDDSEGKLETNFVGTKADSLNYAHNKAHHTKILSDESQA